MAATKKLHIPGVDGLRARVRNATVSASETSAELLDRLAERLRDWASRESFWDSGGRSEHDAFVRWLEENPDGFFINCRTASDMMLHRSSCPSLIFHGPVSLTRNRKLCSSDKDMLERWASRQWGATLVYCSICAP